MVDAANITTFTTLDSPFFLRFAFGSEEERREHTIGKLSENSPVGSCARSTAHGVRGAKCPSAMLGPWGIEEKHAQSLIFPPVDGGNGSSVRGCWTKRRANL
jgi:hypothetical protein